MNKRFVNYLLCWSLAFGLVSPASLMAAEKKEKARFASVKEFSNRLKEFGYDLGRDASFMNHWAKKKYNQTRYGGPATTAEEDARAKKVMLTKGIPLAVIMLVIVAGAITAAVKTGQWAREQMRQRAAEHAKPTEQERAKRRAELKKIGQTAIDLEPAALTELAKRDLGALNNIFMHAVGSRDLSYIKQVVQAGANIDYQDAKGATPLMIAVLRGDLGIINYLLTFSPNKTLRSKEGRTAYDMAIAMQNGFTKKSNEFKKYARIRSLVA